MADDNSTVPSRLTSLPDDILQHILSFTPTKYAIRTSLLSKRWRHVWCDTPSLSFDRSPKPSWINETLTRYTALKMMRFHFCGSANSLAYVNRWIEFAMSRNVENLSLDTSLNNGVEFEFPDFFYSNSSLKQLTVNLFRANMNPTCSVSWTSLKNLSLTVRKLPNKSIAKILSGCPILRSLTLQSCRELSFLDLSKYPNLTTLRVRYSWRSPGPTEIVAPNIHSLKLVNSHSPCTLLDVSSLAEAKVDICYYPGIIEFKAYFLQVMMLKMLEKLQNVEKLTLEETFLQILSLAEIRGDPFPMFKVKSLTLETGISQYATPGIERMLQNSPDLKIITLHMRTRYGTIREKVLDPYYIYWKNLDQSWRSKNGVLWNKDWSDVKSNHVVSFLELILENAEALEKMVVQFQGSNYRKFKELVPTVLSNKNNVSIVLSTLSEEN